MSASDELFSYLNFLENEAAQSKVLGGLTKASGLFCLATGAITCLTLPGWGLFALGGGLAYCGQLLRESRKTGRLMPVPFSELGIDTIVKGVAKGGGGGDSDDLLDFHYLSPRQKSDYALLSICGEEIGAALDAIPDEHRQRVLWGQVSRRFHQMYGASIDKSPDYVAIAADKSDILTYLLASPETMRVLQREAREYAAQPQTDPQALPSGAVEPVAAIDTRLNAVEVPSSPLAAANYAQPESPAADLAQPIQNSLIIGKGGSGKGILLSNALRAVRQAEPDRTIYIVDPKADPLERPYWDGCHCVASKPCAGLLPLDIWDWVQSCIREFQLLPGPKLLVVDEIRFLSNTFARCNDSKTKALDTFWYIVESFTSLGDASRSHVWAVSQSSHTADLKISGGTLGQFRVMALVDMKDFGFYDTLTATNIVQKHPDPYHLRDSVAAKSPVNRVYYDSKFRKWFPLPELKNYSGRDRDKGIEKPVSVGAPTHTKQIDTTRIDLEALLTQSTTESVEDKVKSYLDKQNKFLPSYQIKSGVSDLKQMSADEVKSLLNRLASEGIIQSKNHGGSVLYGPTGT